MSINVGDKAPDFTLVTLGSNGPETFTLSEAIGSKNIVLLFVPMAFTGGCTKEFCDISQNISTYDQLDATVLGISGDNPFAQAAWAEKEGITISLLADYEHSATEAYGVAYQSFLPEKNLIMGGVPKRSAFVIDKQGVVQYAEVLEVPSDMPDFEAIQQCLKGL
ncbi:redoxin domain-containing protein [Rubritalea marina]|uniref:redoxin domain-containing protein n=1 Tax=Rubritalea marina TaxID=361055 RepID=UPI00036FFFA4|nr:redoxin domain-containing protein [Rubritalea marina]